MPMTPEVARPIGRSDSSSAWNRIACALLLTSSRSSSAETSAAPISSSSSRRLIAMMPPARLESNSVSRVFFTSPCWWPAPGTARPRSSRISMTCGDLLVRLEGEQVGHVLAAGDPAGLRQLVRLGPVDPALVGEEQDPVVGGGDEEVVDDVVLRSCAPLDALAAAPLRPVEVGLGALGVAGAGDRDDHVLLGDQVLHGHLAVERRRSGCAGRRRTSRRSRPARRGRSAAAAPAWPGCP